MTYREPLPEGCPPDDAEEITAPRVVYRLVQSNPPTDDDFQSQRAERPTTRFNASECQARGVSVFADRRDVERQMEVPRLRRSAVAESSWPRERAASRRPAAAPTTPGGPTLSTTSCRTAGW